MRHDRLCPLAVPAGLLAVSAVAALAGAPDPSIIGPARGALDIVLPYYPPTARAAALGRGTVALEGADSHNPAALAFFKDVAKRDHDVALSYGRANLGHGPDMDIYNANLIIPTPVLGGYSKLMAFGIHTRHQDVSRMMGLEADVSAYQLGIASGVKVPLPDGVPGELAAGFAGFPFDPARLNLSAPGDGVIARSHAISNLGSIRLGTMYKPTPQVTFGAVFTHIKDEAWARFPGAGLPSRLKSNYHVNIYEVGVAVRPIPSTVAMVQFLGGTATGEGVDIRYSIPSLGVEHEVRVTEKLGFALRAGWLDNGPTYGLGLKLPADWRADYAFIPHYGEGLKTAFGHGPFHMLTVGKSF